MSRASDQRDKLPECQPRSSLPASCTHAKRKPADGIKHHLELGIVLCAMLGEDEGGVFDVLAPFQGRKLRPEATTSLASARVS
jgi:hypothetical protein